MEMKVQNYLDPQKGSSFFVVLLLMVMYDQWQNPTAWVYLALHGSYGFLWVIKGQVFPDKQWQQKKSVLFALIGTGALFLYWIAPWLLTSRGVQAPYWLMSLCIALYIFGVFLHFTADMQKYVYLKLRPNQLITNGLWSRVRNPNYFGELLIYSSFAIISIHWLSYMIVAVWVVFYWLPNMRKKDESLSRYPEFSNYEKRTKLFIPFLY
jgi:steroid 5-alpha reductase family enzyme